MIHIRNDYWKGYKLYLETANNTLFETSKALESSATSTPDRREGELGGESKHLKPILRSHQHAPFFRRSKLLVKHKYEVASRHLGQRSKVRSAGELEG
jgi:hypothetical protein